ncbi:MAG: TonB family protein [Saprospiraceae bacterium]|nr:TonB family protein [Saprospiraceae bacterium]
MENTDYAQQIEHALFAFKNKDYGAYVVRQKRTSNLTWGMVGALVGLGLLYVSPLLLFFLTRATAPEPTEEVTAVNVTPYSELVAPPPVQQDEKPKEKPREAVLAPPQVSTVKFVKPVVKADAEAPDEDLIPTVKELTQANPGRVTQEGSGDLYADYVQQKVVLDQPKTQETAPPAPPTPPARPKPAPPPAPKEVYDFVSKKPEFPGGELALMNYISTSIRYPSLARDANIEGTVVVRFIIDFEGKVQSIEILKDIGGGCGAEAVRVVGNMPQWIPGEQNGRPVNVRFVLPVRFKLQKEG